MIVSLRRVAFLLILLVVSCSLFLFRYHILDYIGTYLIVADPLEQVDAIVVLSGDPVSRCQTAADLFLQGWASRVLITKGARPYEREQLRRYGIQELEPHEKCLTVLTFNAVPEHVIEILDGYNESTIDEVQTLHRRLQAPGLQRLMIVTSNFHTRRSRMLFRRALSGDGIQVSVQATPPNFIFDPHDWWTRRYDRKILLGEYQKFFFYALRYW